MSYEGEKSREAKISKFLRVTGPSTQFSNHQKSINMLQCQILPSLLYESKKNWGNERTDKTKINAAEIT
jgi:hypothetical protein